MSQPSRNQIEMSGDGSYIGRSIEARAKDIHEFFLLVCWCMCASMDIGVGIGIDDSRKVEDGG